MSGINHAFNAIFASASNGPDTVEDHKPKLPGTFPSSPPSSPANVSVVQISCLLIPRHLFLSQTKSKRPLSPARPDHQPISKRKKTQHTEADSQVKSVDSDDDEASCFYDVSQLPTLCLLILADLSGARVPTPASPAQGRSQRFRCGRRRKFSIPSPSRYPRPQVFISFPKSSSLLPSLHLFTKSSSLFPSFHHFPRVFNPFRMFSILFPGLRHFPSTHN